MDINNIHPASLCSCVESNRHIDYTKYDRHLTYPHPASIINNYFYVYHTNKSNYTKLSQSQTQ